MIAAGPGWYIYTAPTRERFPTDLFGPFDSLPELEDWLMDNGIPLLDRPPPPEGTVRYFTEMTDDDLSDCDYSPWACQPHQR